MDELVPADRQAPTLDDGHSTWGVATFSLTEAELRSFALRLQLRSWAFVVAIAVALVTGELLGFCFWLGTHDGGGLIFTSVFAAVVAGPVACLTVRSRVHQRLVGDAPRCQVTFGDVGITSVVEGGRRDVLPWSSVRRLRRVRHGFYFEARRLGRRVEAGSFLGVFVPDRALAGDLAALRSRVSLKLATSDTTDSI
jgi:hypothetical protein